MNSATKLAGLAAAVLLSCAAINSAAADDRATAIFNFCVNAGAPSDELDKVKILPSGAMRREMSAGELMREAWIANQASKSQTTDDMRNKLRNRAIQYILICEAHDQGAWQHIANNNQMFIDLLNGWTPSFSPNGMN